MGPTKISIFALLSENGEPFLHEYISITMFKQGAINLLELVQMYGKW